WPQEWRKSLDLFFLVREMRFISEMSGSNWLADLDLYLRHTRLRTPILAVQNSDEFRLALAEKFAARSRSVSAEALPDLIAGALARRDFPAAIQLLETEKDRGFSNINDFFLLIYLYCLNGSVEKAEALAAAQASSIQKDWFVDWLWGELQAEFGFHPPGGIRVNSPLWHIPPSNIDRSCRRCNRTPFDATLRSRSVEPPHLQAGLDRA